MTPAADQATVAVVPFDDVNRRPQPSNLAAELLRCIERQALLDPEDDHPFRVSIVATRAEGDEFFVVFRQGWSPDLYGKRENAADLWSGFMPRQTPAELADIVLQDLSEPHGHGRPGPDRWGAGLVPDPAEIGWV